MKALFALSIALLLLFGCAGYTQPPIPLPQQNQTANTSGGGVGLANPASVFCIDSGYESVLRGSVTSPSGVGGGGAAGQVGYCIFPNGRECEEWAFFRGECTDADSFEFVQSPGFVADPKEVSYKFYEDGRLQLTEKWLRNGSSSTLTAWLKQEDFVSFVKKLKSYGFDSFEASYESCRGKGFAGCPTDMPYLRVTLLRQGDEKKVSIYAPADRPESLDNLIVDFKKMFEQNEFVAVDVSGCKLMQNRETGWLACFGCVSGITNPQCTQPEAGFEAVSDAEGMGSCTVDSGGACVYLPPEQMTRKLCESSGGSFGECVFMGACRSPEISPTCSACYSACECGEGVGSCPSGYFCTDFAPNSATKPGATGGKMTGVCKMVQ